MVRSGAAGTADLVEYAEVHHEVMDGPTLVICEGVPGGLGFARELFDLLEHYLELASDRLQRCPCRRPSGCPSCILSRRRCPQRNEPLDKLVLRDFLGGLVGFLRRRRPWTPPGLPRHPCLGETWAPGDSYPGGGEVHLSDENGVVIFRPSGQPLRLPWRE